MVGRMNRTLTLSRLEVGLHFVEQEINRLEILAVHLSDLTQREEARIEAAKKRQEAEEIRRRIEHI
jgi:hypothetical protein